MKPLITICMPCFGRPLRTRRMLLSLASQTLKNFELVMIGDCCPDFKQMIRSDWFSKWKDQFKKRGNELFYMNLATTRGGHGAGAVNIAISVARGKYFCWANNDDMVLAEHMEFYYNSICRLQFDDQRCDFVYNQTYINGEGGFDIREPVLKFGGCGHSELVVNTQFLKSMKPHQPEYGQDWILIEEMMKRGMGKRGDIPFPTYYVMSTPRFQEQGID